MNLKHNIYLYYYVNSILVIVFDKNNLHNFYNTRNFNKYDDYNY